MTSLALWILKFPSSRSSILPSKVSSINLHQKMVFPALHMAHNPASTNFVIAAADPAIPSAFRDLMLGLPWLLENEREDHEPMQFLQMMDPPEAANWLVPLQVTSACAFVLETVNAPPYTIGPTFFLVAVFHFLLRGG